MLGKNLAAQICELHTMSWEFRGVPDEVQTEKRVWADPMSPGKEQGYSKWMCNSKLQNSLEGMPCVFWSFVATMTASYKKSGKNMYQLFFFQSITQLPWNFGHVFSAFLRWYGDCKHLTWKKVGERYSLKIGRLNANDILKF